MRDYLLVSLTFPVALIVFINFWPVFFYDRELILPIKLEIDGTFPAWLNYVVHFVILPVNLIQFYFDKPNYADDKSSLIGLFSYASVYTAMLFVHRHNSGHFVYRFLDKFNNFQVTGFVLGAIAMAYVSFRIGKWFTCFFQLARPSAKRKKPVVKMAILKSE